MNSHLKLSYNGEWVVDYLPLAKRLARDPPGYKPKPKDSVLPKYQQD
jgi:hypothetical protein